MPLLLSGWNDRPPPSTLRWLHRSPPHSDASTLKTHAPLLGYARKDDTPSPRPSAPPSPNAFGAAPAAARQVPPQP